MAYIKRKRLEISNPPISIEATYSPAPVLENQSETRKTHSIDMPKEPVEIEAYYQRKEEEGKS